MRSWPEEWRTEYSGRERTSKDMEARKGQTCLRYRKTVPASRAGGGGRQGLGGRQWWHYKGLAGHGEEMGFCSIKEFQGEGVCGMIYVCF